MQNHLIITDEERSDDVEIISVNKLREFYNPFSAWFELMGSPITKDEVFACIEAGEAELVFTELFTQADKFTEDQANEARINHIKKIAYFVVNGVRDPIDVECLDSDDFRVNDGNHRLCAAIILGYTHIKAYLGGFLDCAYEAELLPES